MAGADPKPDRRRSRPRGRRSQSAGIGVKRVYDAFDAADGLRILIDRLWPRGLSKAVLKLDAWPRELAPSTALRKWYGHEPSRYPEFRRRYLKELTGHPDELAALRALIKGKCATLLSATRDLELSHAGVLREALLAG